MISIFIPFDLRSFLKVADFDIYLCVKKLKALFRAMPKLPIEDNGDYSVHLIESVIKVLLRQKPDNINS